MSLVPPAEFETSRNLLFEQLGVVAYCYKPRTSLQLLLRKVREALMPPDDEEGPEFGAAENDETEA
jgi:hypothetical protein